MAKLPLAGQSYSLASLAAAAQQTLNFFPELIEDPQEAGKTRAILRHTPGYRLFKSLGVNSIWGMWSGGGRLFVSAGGPGGAHQYEIGQGTYSWGAGTGSGSIISNVAYPVSVAGVAQMFGNGQQLVTIQNGWVFVDNGAGPVQATFSGGAGPVTAVTGCYLDGYTIVQRPAGGSPDLGRQFNFSAINDATSWDPLDFSVKEGSPDYIQSVFADHEQLYLFGTESTEVWQNVGDLNSPFQRVPGAMMREGSISTYAPVSLGGSVYFLGGSPRGNAVAYRMNGFTPERISTSAVEAQWRKFAIDPRQFVGHAEIIDGHLFWVLTIGTNSENAWVYDATTKMWHERNTWNGTAFTNYRGWFHTFIPEWGNAGVHIIGDMGSGNLYELTMDYGDEAGADVRRIRSLPYMDKGILRRFFGPLALDMETGTTSSLVTEPTITLDYSDDKGKTWKNPRTRGIGLAGDTSKRVIWRQNGSSIHGRIPRFSVTGQMPVTLVDLDEGAVV